MKKSTATITLSTNEAIVLQQVHEGGEDDAQSLASQLGMSRNHTMNIIQRLKQKGLVAIDSDVDGIWVHMTRRGHKLMSYMWPQAHGSFA